MNSDLKVGDVVYLNSKPEVKLTVSKVVDTTRIELTYYDEDLKRWETSLSSNPMSLVNSLLL